MNKIKEKLNKIETTKLSKRYGIDENGQQIKIVNKIQNSLEPVFKIAFICFKVSGLKKFEVTFGVYFLKWQPCPFPEIVF